MRLIIFTLLFAISNANSIEEVLVKNFADADLPLSETCSPQFEEYLNRLKEFDTDFWAWQSKYQKIKKKLLILVLI